MNTVFPGVQTAAAHVPISIAEHTVEFVRCLKIMANLLTNSATQCASSIPSVDNSSEITVYARYMQEAIKDRSLPSENKCLVLGACIWNWVTELNIDRLLAELLTSLQPMMTGRSSDNFHHNHTRISSSSSSHVSCSSSIRKEHASGSKHDRAKAASSAQRTLRDRRLQADPYPIDLLLALHAGMQLLTLLLSADGTGDENTSAKSGMLTEKLFQVIDNTMHYLLRFCTDFNFGDKDKLPPQHADHIDVWNNTIISVCLASRHMLVNTCSLPLEHKALLVTCIPARFLDTLCCLAVEGLAEIKPFDDKAESAMLDLSLLYLHCSGYNKQGPFPCILDPALKAAIPVTQSFSSPYMIRMVCRSLVLIAAKITSQPVIPLPLTSSVQTNLPISSQHDTVAAKAIHLGCSVVSALKQMLTDRYCNIVLALSVDKADSYYDETDYFRKQAAVSHAVLVEGAASSRPRQSSDDSTAQVDVSGVWAMRKGKVGLALLVTGLCRLAGRCTTLIPNEQLPAAVKCLDLAMHLLSMERNESQSVSAYAQGSVEIRGCLSATAHLAAVIATMLGSGSQYGTLRMQQEGHSLLQSVTHQDHCFTPGGKQFPGLTHPDSFRTFVCSMLNLCATEVEKPRKGNGLSSLWLGE